MLKVIKEEEKYLVSISQVNKINTVFSGLIAEQLNELLDVPGRHVILNLSGIHFIDSEGFRTLVLASELSRKNGSSFQICNLSDEVQELMDVTGMKQSLEIAPDMEVREKIDLELDD